MLKLHVTKKALEDLMEIGRYTQNRWGRNQRIKYLNQLDSVFSKLANNPNLGMSYDALRSGYRGYFDGSHIIFFRHNHSHIDIVRILHQSMDVNTHLQYN